MEKTRVDLLRESFSCSICLELLTDPVTLHCGHNYCKSCVEGSWSERNIYQCPQCRQTFTPKPVLQKNTVLAEIVEELKKTQAADLCYAGPEDVACDVCTGRKLKALKSCLICVVSYCEQHLEPHLEAPAFRRHKLVQPSKQLQEIICSRHHEEKKMFCRTDQLVICHLCAEEQHKDHDTVTAAAEKSRQEREVDRRREKIQQMIQEREKEVKQLKEEEKKITVSADKAVEDSHEINQLIQNVQRRMTYFEQRIRAHQLIEMARVRELQEQLEQENTELKKKDAELQQLSLTNSHTVFLQNFSLPEVSEDMLTPRPCMFRSSFEEVTHAMWSCSKGLLDAVRDTLIDTSPMPHSEPKTRAEFLRYSLDITMDPNTAQTTLKLSEGNRKVTGMVEHQSLPHHPDRFWHYPQVLSKTPLTGCCYWEVEWEEEIKIAVSYKHIRKSGEQSYFGDNDKSWALHCDECSCTFTHDSIRTRYRTVPSSRVGVYLDHSAGLLSFYSVAETMTLLHRAQTTFTQPLYAGVCIWIRSCEFVNLK
ncbi:tripartite motif-containing protein 16-like [Synchiropus splendidus]|uniref:tripartite motif-containing protein 16-like n=1 Tax=Synchiropus splendidus TaxID=270530 RepID=UPI00237D9C97|nr:tripartite motif-containing protein 16-like [Synchiropus splendidus]XP_053709278.1 tripartite motif-containing protein 16-like [Synchiropus splendidus]